MSLGRTVLSGIQPTGVPHLGNYLGALRSWVTLSRDESASQVLFSVVDLHALTTPAKTTPVQLSESIVTTASVLLACGIDTSRCALFQQSQVSAHAELAWVLSCTASMGWLSRMTQWKSKFKSAENPLDPSLGMKLGLYSYPVLQAADILAYRATHVPVGEDQHQHLELARDIAKAFNSTYGTNYFPLPAAMSFTPTKRIMSLRDPKSKMSKSDPLPASRIELTDSADDIARKIRRSVTDSHKYVSLDREERPGVANLLSIYAGLRDVTPEAAAEELASCDMQSLKERVTEVVVESLMPVRSRFLELQGDRAYVLSVLREGRDKARSIADGNWRQVQRLVGIADVTEVKRQ
ncbi:Tryptophan--tRNA ligase, mitochondrial [Sorochytrium milnesiophthora]